jgi:hypothetical protein
MEEFVAPSSDIHQVKSGGVSSINYQCFERSDTASMRRSPYSNLKYRDD